MVANTKYKTIIIPSTFVLDASVMMAWLLNEKISTNLQLLMQKVASTETNPIVPDLLNFEVVNVLCNVLRSRRINLAQANDCLNTFGLLDLTTVSSISLPELLQISLDFNITSYDATYVYLAKEYSIPLCTIDAKLQKKVQGHVEILDLGQIDAATRHPELVS